MEPEDPFLSVGEAARYLGFVYPDGTPNPRSIRWLMEKREIVFYKFGKHVKLRQSDLEDYVRSRRVETE